jgi:DNA-binding NarL/FixJ family response regulator
MVDRIHDDLPADFERELLEYEAEFKTLVEHLLQGDPPRGPPASTARQTPALRTSGRIRLTAREAQVIRLLVMGQTNQQIGAALHLRAGTVRNHLSGIYRKLGVRTRTQAAVRAVELGLSSNDPSTQQH